jgi:hypothetical protein
VIAGNRNLLLAKTALVAIAPDETYALVRRRSAPKGSAAALREAGTTTYVESWLQYWLAPRLRVDPADAQWLIVLHAGPGAAPEGSREVHRIRDDLLVRRR